MSGSGGKHGGLVAALDVGGTKTLAAVYSADGTAMAQVRRPTRTNGAGGLVAFLVSILTEVMAVAEIRPEHLGAIGVGAPGVVDMVAGTVRHAVNLGVGDEPVDLAGPLGELIEGPVRVANDVNMAALGAAELLGIRDVGYLSIGTGVALGLVFGGEIHPGSMGTAGEIGHLPVDPDGPLCECGQRGCLEVVASGRAIARLWPGDDGPGSSEPHLAVPGHLDGADGVPLQPAAALLRAAAAGDARAIAVRREICNRLADVVSLVVQTVDPDIIVLGGGVAEAGDLLLAEVRRTLDRRAERSRFIAALNLARRVILLPPGLTVVTAGAIGAARFAWSAAMPRSPS